MLNDGLHVFSCTSDESGRDAIEKVTAVRRLEGELRSRAGDAQAIRREWLCAERQLHASRRRVGVQVGELAAQVSDAVAAGNGREVQGAEDAESPALGVEIGTPGVAGDPG